jgi:hypothetical protein
MVLSSLRHWLKSRRQKPGSVRGFDAACEEVWTCHHADKRNMERDQRWPDSSSRVVAHRQETACPIHAVRPEVPVALAGVDERMMAKAPADRDPSAAAVAEALALFAAGRAPRPPRPRRRLLLAAAALLAVAAAAAVLVRVQTDKGEVTLQTDDPTIELVVAKGGKLVRIVDPKSGQKWELDPEKFQLGLADSPDGLTIDLDGPRPFILGRKGEKLVTITRAPPAEKPGAAARASPVDKAGQVRRIEWWSTAHDISIHVYHTTFSPNGRLYLAGGDAGELRLWDVATGKLVHEFKGHEGWTSGAAFTPDGKYTSGGDN